MAKHVRSSVSRRAEATPRKLAANRGEEVGPVRGATASPEDDRWRDFLLRAAVLVLAVLWVYSPVIHPVFPADWLWDDDQLLTANATVQHRVSPDPKSPPEHIRTLAKLWFNPDGADYFPLSYTALWAQWPFFGMWPTGYHLVTVLLHLAGVMLLWRLLVVMQIPGAWLAAMIFAVHPVCVESVAWVSELKNTLSLPLFLLAAIHFVRFDDLVSDESTPLLGGNAPRGALRHYLLSLGYFLLAMLAKTSVVMMPVALLLYAWWKRGRVTFRNLVYASPFFLISLVLGLITIYYQWGRAIGQEKILVGGVDSRIASAGMSILWYLRLIFWPVNLLPIYPRWEVDPPKVWQFLTWPVIAAIGWWFWKNRAAAWPPNWGRHALFAFGFFLVMVAPVLGFVTISYMRITWAADHFIYLPMISIIALVTAGLAAFFERCKVVGERVAILIGAALLLGALTYLGFRYAGCWVNEDALWEHTLKHNFDAWQAHNRLGARKFARGDVAGAHFHFQNSTRLRPDLGETHNNLGTTLSARAQMLAQQGDQAGAKREMDEAIFQFSEATRVTPHVPMIRVNLANALAAAGRYSEAADNYRSLLEIEPRNAALLNNYGVALYKQGLTDEAVKQFRLALEISPDLKDAKESLAVALGEKPDPALSEPAGQRPPPLQMQPFRSPTLDMPLR